MSLLTHITPRFSPQLDGLGDYARLLGTELKREFGLRKSICGWRPALERRFSEFAISCEGGEGPRCGRAVSFVTTNGDGDLALLQLRLSSPRYSFWTNIAIRRWKGREGGADSSSSSSMNFGLPGRPGKANST